MKKRILLSFSGIDGSGKTTLALNLRDWFKEKGIKVTITWGAYELFILKPLVVFGKILFLKKAKRPDDYPKYYNSIIAVSKNRGLAFIYEKLTFAEYILQIWWKVGIPLLLGKNVVCDRYIYDTIVNLAVSLSYTPQELVNKINKLLKICPKPTIIFFVDLPEEIAYKRKNDIPALDYLKRRREYYHTLSEEYGMICLDGTKKVTELENQIRDSVAKLVFSKNEF